ncbi:uncharacterized protein LODBEIA_P44260 [Lodderomyces beijingensis]|uniref:Skg3/CAF120-like PH-like domain-containing protein n=1 Tax=Lodderomyces beijingensis TaxID=1775926 RepID=A0ABP0ZV24_9ASCO
MPLTSLLSPKRFRSSSRASSATTENSNFTTDKITLQPNYTEPTSLQHTPEYNALHHATQRQADADPSSSSLGLGATPLGSPAQRVKSPLSRPPTTFEDTFGQAQAQAPPLAKSNSDDSGRMSTGDDVSKISPVFDQYSLQPTNSKMSGAHITGSIPRRALSEKARKAPSSFVRRSRLLSADEDDAVSLNSLTGRSLLLQSKLESEHLLPELRPIVSLLNAQKLRTYCHGSFQIPGYMGEERVWFEVDAKLTGDELAIWRPSTDAYVIDDNDEFKPKYINLIDARLESLGNLQIKIFQDYSDRAVLIKFHNTADMNKWLAAITLTKFEYAKLNEAFTAVVLSAKGSKLSDIHVLLSRKKRFPQYEWCNVRLPEVSSKWIKVYMIILPSDKHHLGRIEFYPNEKKTGKKNLIAYISDLAYIFNVYPEQSNMIDSNSIMSAAGKVYVNRSFDHLFPYEDPRKLIAKNHSSAMSRSGSVSGSISRSGSNNSLSSLNSGTRSRSGSVNSTNSFFNHTPSPCNTQTRDRSDSLNKTDSGFFKKHADAFVATNTMYIMPIPHPGVSAVETMIRNFIPIIDAFKLYGRPQHLISDKANPDSMLFGLPSLPHHQYLSIGEATEAFNQHYQPSMGPFQMEDVLKDKIVSLMRSKPYRGHGNIARLYEKLDLDFEEFSSPPYSPQISQQISGLSPLGDPINLDQQPRVASPLSV